MSGVPYDPEHIARFYNEYGAREWERFDVSAMDRVGLEAHLRLLREHIRDGDRVLDAGAGPGRFTLELARIGARVVVGDIAPAQLELHAEKTASVEDAIECRELLDITDLGRFPDGSFDACDPEGAIAVGPQGSFQNTGPRQRSSAQDVPSMSVATITTRSR